MKNEDIDLMIGNVSSLLKSESIVNSGRIAFRKQYPSAPESFIEPAVFHTYIKGPRACVKWLSHIGDFLKNPAVGIDWGILYQVMHHFYNLLAFNELAKSYSQEVLDLLEDLKSSYEDKNMVHIGICIDKLKYALSCRIRLHPEIQSSETGF